MVRECPSLTRIEYQMGYVSGDGFREMGSTLIVGFLIVVIECLTLLRKQFESPVPGPGFRAPC